MNFSSSIPTELQNDEQTKKFIKVLDLLSKHEEIQLNKFIDGFNKKVIRGRDPLSIKLLSELGLYKLPNFLNKWQLDALYINSTNILKWKGSLKGLELLLWCLTAGFVYIDTNNFHPIADYIIPSDETFGFCSNINPVNTQTLYLFSSELNFGDSTLYIELDSPFLNDIALEEYITDSVIYYLGFISEVNFYLYIDFFNGPYATSTISSPYFTI